MRLILIKLIHCYQYLISPLRPPVCRFYPSCSHYACDAIEHHGVVIGIWYILKRIIRCNPLSSGGYDPIP